MVNRLALESSGTILKAARYGVLSGIVLASTAGYAHADPQDFVREQMDAHFTLLEKIQVLQNSDLDFGAIAFGGSTVSGQCRIRFDPEEGMGAARQIVDSSSQDCASAALIGDGASIGRLVYDGSVGSVTVPDEDLHFTGVDAWLRPAVHHDPDAREVFVGGDLVLDADRDENGLREGRYTVTVDVDLHYRHLE